MRKGTIILILFIFLSSVLSAQVTLPPGLYKKGTRPDSAQKRPTPSPKKDSASVKKETNEISKEEKEKKADTTPMQEEDGLSPLEGLKKTKNMMSRLYCLLWRVRSFISTENIQRQ